MNLQILTAANIPAVERIVKDARGEAFNVADLFPATGRYLVVADLTIPALVRLEHYQINPPELRAQQLAHFPPALAALVAAANYWSTTVTDFYPLPIRAPGGAAQVAAQLILLATVLRGVRTRFPVVGARPVWANFDPQLVSFMVNGVPAAGIAAPFPLAGHDDRYIWHGALKDAALAADSLAVTV